MGLFHYYNIYFNNKHGTIQIISQKPIFLKSICGGSSKIWAGLYNGTATELALKTDTDNAKTTLANAIVSKGGTATSSMTFAQLASAIEELSANINTKVDGGYSRGSQYPSFKIKPGYILVYVTSGDNWSGTVERMNLDCSFTMLSVLNNSYTASNFWRLSYTNDTLMVSMYANPGSYRYITYCVLG